MSTFVLIHGAGGDAWVWHLVEPALRARGHEVVAVDLPCDDDGAGWADYADTVVEAVGGRRDLVVVGQSLGGFSAPLVCEQLPVRTLVLLTAMIPRPGERAADWWAATEMPEVGDDLEELFLHDVPPALRAEAMRHDRDQSSTPMGEAWPLDRWPDVPTRFLLCRDDRFFPADWMRGVVQDRLGFPPDEIDGGHCVALSRPDDLAARLAAYPTE